MDLVIGSGPSGAACAAALLAQGRRVHMLDAGLRLEPDRQAAIESIRAAAEPWLPEHAPWHVASATQASEKIPSKLLFGSDYPFREATERIGLVSEGTGLRPSMALGGHSTVWGASMLPYTERDIADWPIGTKDLAPHYKEVLKLTGISAMVDDSDSLNGLNDLLPIYAPAPGRLKASRQAANMILTMKRNHDRLRRSGIQYGGARVAIRANDPAVGTNGCIYCGMCLSGCPFGYIYSAERTIESLRDSESFTYQGDAVVTSVEEMTGRAIVHGYHRLTGAPLAIEGNRIFLACGVLPTTKILLRSLGAYDHTVHLLDSQYFFLPALLISRPTGVERERLHTLSQLFIEILNEKISPHLIHVQVYSFNSLIAARVRATLGPLADVFGGALSREAGARLLAFQGYLHSAHSSRLAVTLHKAGGGDRLEVAAVLNPVATRMARWVARKLLRNGPRLGAIAVPMMLEVAEPGRGFHSGGSFPMRRDPGAFETDMLGRLHGWRRVHAVDATVLPSIAATTVTLAVMANAHRIGTVAAGLTDSL